MLPSPPRDGVYTSRSVRVVDERVVDGRLRPDELRGRGTVTFTVVLPLGRYLVVRVLRDRVIAMIPLLFF